MTTPRRRFIRNSRASPPTRLRSCPVLLATAVALACRPAPLQAQASRIGGEVALASHLVDRGLAITPATPVLQGAISWASPGGWSLGLAGGVEARSPGRPVMALARVSRSWALSDDWRAQAGLLYYDYRRNRMPDRAEANLYFTYRDSVTLGLSAIHVGDDGERHFRGAVDVAVSWPLTRHVSLSAGAGIAEVAVGSYGPGHHSYYEHGYGYGYGYSRLRTYGYGNLGLAWSDGPWRLQVDRNMNSLGARRVYGAHAPPHWVASLTRSF